MRKPYYRRDRGAWYVKVDGGRSQIRLHENEQKAYEIWQEMLRLNNPGAPNTTFATIADCFLLAARQLVTDKTFRGYTDDLLSACRVFGEVMVRDLKKHHVTTWLDRQTTWGPWARRRAAAVVKRALNWAVDEGHLEKNPLGRLDLPKGGKRDAFISDASHAAMMTAVDCGRQPGQRIAGLGRRPVRRDACFRLVLVALKHSGARPGMVAAVTAEQVTPSVDAWILPEHKTRKKTGAPLVVRLSPCLQTLTRILLANGRSSGPLFRNSRGQPWTSNAIRCRMRTMQKKLGLPEGTVAYAYRHTWTTNAILNGVNLAVVATMLGHKDLRMLMEHYAHLERQPEHLMEAAAKAVQRRA